jgi:hypothetical protein
MPGSALAIASAAFVSNGSSIAVCIDIRQTVLTTDFMVMAELFSQP